MRAVVAACTRHGKRAVTVGIGAEMLSLCLRTGFHLIVGGSDVAFLAQSSRQAAADARSGAAAGEATLPIANRQAASGPY
jgi:2-keto-3-deoxy-L-rhamnonate aldolase RhmA